MGNSFIEDLIRSVNRDTRYSEVEKRIIANRLLPPPTQEEIDLARSQAPSEESVVNL
jgi:hypothetical protein